MMHLVDKNRLYVRIQTEYLDENRFSCDIFCSIRQVIMRCGFVIRLFINKAITHKFKILKHLIQFLFTRTFTNERAHVHLLWDNRRSLSLDLILVPGAHDDWHWLGVALNILVVSAPGGAATVSVHLLFFFDNVRDNQDS